MFRKQTIARKMWDQDSWARRSEALSYANISSPVFPAEVLLPAVGIEEAVLGQAIDQLPIDREELGFARLLMSVE
jgi:hypothetical protein